ncbi:MAG: rod shape-determining protein MreC [Actinobacteria bacterium]|nr:rod shape-determining protein MreC [Cyanobacteriota bacterium]MCL6088049.1 rod shape-determining protein MreC [Actinomycetota bacterium]
MASPRNSIKNIIVISIIVIICLIVITASFRDADFVKSFKIKTLDIFKPLQEKIFIAFQPLITGVNNIKNFFGLTTKLKQLEEDKAKLLRDYSENINLKIENNSLRELLNIKQRNNYKTVAAKVIGYNEGKWQSEITLNVGKNNGVVEGMGVINEKGFIGIVILSASDSCKVRLLNDSQMSIGARLLSSRSLGLVEGSSGKKIFLNYIPKDELVYTGDIVITSEFGKYIPPEILIGIVKKATTSESSPYKIIEIEPFVNFRTIENVLVIQEW